MAKRHRRNNDAGIALLIILAIGAVSYFFVSIINLSQGYAHVILIKTGLIISLITIIYIVQMLDRSKRLQAIKNSFQNFIICSPFNQIRQGYII